MRSSFRWYLNDFLSSHGWRMLRKTCIVTHLMRFIFPMGYSRLSRYVPFCMHLVTHVVADPCRRHMQRASRYSPVLKETLPSGLPRSTKRRVARVPPQIRPLTSINIKGRRSSKPLQRMDYTVFGYISSRTPQSRNRDELSSPEVLGVLLN